MFKRSEKETEDQKLRPRSTKESSDDKIVFSSCFLRKLESLFVQVDGNIEWAKSFKAFSFEI